MKTTMNMRAVLAMLLALTMVFAFAGCGTSVPNEEFLALQAEMEDIFAEVEALRTDKETLQAEIDRLLEENDGLTEELEALLAQLEAIEETLEVAEETLETTSSAIETAVASSTASSSSSSSAPATSQASSSTASVPATTQTSSASSTAPAAATGTGPLSGYKITVTDWKTIATKATGAIGGSTYTFYSAGGVALGSMNANDAAGLWASANLNDERSAWFAKQFNVYRGLGTGGVDSSGGSVSTEGSTGGSDSGRYADIATLQSELIRITNKTREANGFPALTTDSDAMNFAQLRAKELVESYSHIRPDGTTMTYGSLNFAEIIYRSPKTAQAAMDGWMASSGHKAAILSDYSDYGNRFGVGVYQDSNGTLYWVQVFVIWDANA